MMVWYVSCSLARQMAIRTAYIYPFLQKLDAQDKQKNGGKKKTWKAKLSSIDLVRK